MSIAVRRAAGVTAAEARVVGKAADQPAAVVRGDRPLVDDRAAAIPAVADAAAAAPHRDPRPDRQRGRR